MADELPLPKENVECHRRDRMCYDGVVKGRCRLWKSVKYIDKSTGGFVDEWACVDEHAHKMLLLLASETFCAGKETEKLRNAFFDPVARKQEIEEAIRRNGNIEQSATLALEAMP